MLSKLYVALVEILLCSFFLLTVSLGQLKQYVVFDIFEFDGRDPSLDDSFPEGVDVHLHERDRPYEQIVASSNKVNI